MGTVYDDPNRECLGLDPAWVEGTGGVGGGTVEADERGASDNPLDDMTKDELLAYAQEIGASPANAAMTKAELRESIEAVEG